MTIRELAAELRLSKSTVASALGGKGRISEATRDSILRRANELGYTPNPLTAAMLRQVRSRSSPRVEASVALITKSAAPPTMTIDRIFSGFNDRARQIGLMAEEFNTENWTSKQLLRVLLARGVQGVALMPLPRAIGHRTLDWSHFASVSFGYSITRPRMHRVVHNHIDGIRTTLRMCRRKGFRRIGIALTEQSNLRSYGLWLLGFLEHQKQIPPRDQVAPFLVRDAEWTRSNILRWMSKERPEVVILHKPDPGLRIPQLFEDHPSPAIPVLLDNWRGGQYAGIDQEYEKLGGAMADLIARQLIHNERGIPANPTLTLLEGTWIGHPSLAR